MRQTPNETDEGKPVFNVDDQKVGVVTKVEAGIAYVDPHPSLVNEYKMLLGWKDESKEVYPLPEDAIAEITGREIRLQTHDSAHATK